jgi:hypothetical protein
MCEKVKITAPYCTICMYTDLDTWSESCTGPPCILWAKTPHYRGEEKPYFQSQKANKAGRKPTQIKPMCRMLRIINTFQKNNFTVGTPKIFSMELDGSHLGSLGFSRTDLNECVLMHFKDTICLRKLLLKMAPNTVCCCVLIYFLTLKELRAVSKVSLRV